MPIPMQCENAACGKSFRAADASAGKRVRCPGCGQLARVPAVEAADDDSHIGPQSTQRAGRREAPGLGKVFATFCWILFSAATLACLAFAGYTVVEIKEQTKRIHEVPEVKQAAEDWLVRSEPGSFERYQVAIAKASPAVAPDEALLRQHVLIGVAAAGVAALLTLIAFVVMLAKSRLRFVYEFYVFCSFIGPLLAGIGLGAGAGLMWFATTNLDNAPAVKQLRDRRQQASAQGDHLESHRLQEQIIQRTDRFNSNQCLAGMGTMAVSALVGAVALLGVPFCFAVLLVKLWEQVQDGQARTTPGFALGGLLIPLFNLYWAFVALPGVARELNRCADNQGLKVKPASVGMMVTYCVLCLLAAIPFLGVLAVLANVFVGISAFGSATRVAEALAKAAPAASSLDGKRRWPWYVGSAAAALCVAGALAYFFLMPEEIGNTARRANEMTSSRNKTTWLATNREVDTVCVVKLNGTFPVNTFNAIAKEKKYAMAGTRRLEFMMTEAMKNHGLLGDSEWVILIFVVPRDAAIVTLHLGDSPPIELNLGSKIAEKLQFD